jgi:hypothetical protein
MACSYLRARSAKAGRHSPSVTPSKGLARACYTRRATFSLSHLRKLTNLTTMTEKPIAMRTTYRRCGQVGSANLTTHLTSNFLLRLREEVGQVAVRNQEGNLTNEKPLNTPKTSAMVRLVRSRKTMGRRLVRVRAHHPASGRGSSYEFPATPGRPERSGSHPHAGARRLACRRPGRSPDGDPQEFSEVRELPLCIEAPTALEHILVPQPSVCCVRRVTSRCRVKSQDSYLPSS